MHVGVYKALKVMEAAGDVLRTLGQVCSVEVVLEVQ